MHRSTWLFGVISFLVTICVIAQPIEASRDRKCSAKHSNYLNAIEDVEDLKIGVQDHVLLKENQTKRFLLSLQDPSPLFIKFSSHPQNVGRKLFFNQSVKLDRYVKATSGSPSSEIFLPCALQGTYDLLINPRGGGGSIKIEAFNRHPAADWSLLNQTIPVKIRTQNRMKRNKMVIKWNKSRLDYHAVHYCVIINPFGRQRNFCQAVAASLSKRNSCYPRTPMENAQLRPVEMTRVVDPNGVNVICTGKRNQQNVRGLIPNVKYYIDVFGVHTGKRNLTFLLKSTSVWFNKTHPPELKENALTMGKISGPSKVSVFSFKIPNKPPPINSEIRYLILPCNGTEIDVRILKQRQEVLTRLALHKPTYITVNNAQPGHRYIVRVNASNENDILRATKIAVSTDRHFANLPELPENITISEVRSQESCQSTTISWHSSPDKRRKRYCVIVFPLPNRFRSTYTDYCTDFGPNVKFNDQIHSIECLDWNTRRNQIESFELFNLNRGKSYLVYVTVNLVKGKTLPYESLRIKVSRHCHNEVDEPYYN